MTAQIPALIDKLDTFEIVRDKIALILFEEAAEQQVLAVAAAEDPTLWDLRVYTERSNDIEQFLNPDDLIKTPVVNVWFDSASFPQDSGDTIERQMSDTVYNIDIYGYSESSNVVAGGHKPGDREAAFEAHRAFRLVRNILMSPHYAYLGLRKTVWQRWPISVTSFQPEMSGKPVEHVVAVRLALGVKFSEFTAQDVGGVIGEIFVDVFRAEDGLITLEADYVHP